MEEAVIRGAVTDTTRFSGVEPQLLPTRTFFF